MGKWLVVYSSVTGNTKKVAEAIAAAAGEAFRGLRGATRHLLTASGSGQELLERDARADVLAAAEVDAAASVPVLRDGTFATYD